MGRKEMWLPKTETNVTVDEAGRVRVWDEITMTLRPIPEKPGFGEPRDEGKRPGVKQGG